MTEKPLLRLDSEDIPAVTIPGANDVGILNLTTVMDLIDAPLRAHTAADELALSPDTIESLRASVNTLADTVRLLAAELYNLGRGIESGRVAAWHDD